VYLGTPFQFPARELTLFLVPLLTSQKSRHLFQKFVNIIILFDGDSAGEKGARKTGGLYQRGLG
jgi:hypothetical protein